MRDYVVKTFVGYVGKDANEKEFTGVYDLKKAKRFTEEEAIKFASVWSKKMPNTRIERHSICDFVKSYYEVLWYTQIDESGNYDGDPVYEEFETKKQALAFYHKHEKDEGKYGWWVTKRDSDGWVLDDIVC